MNQFINEMRHKLHDIGITCRGLSKEQSAAVYDLIIKELKGIESNQARLIGELKIRLSELKETQGLLSALINDAEQAKKAKKEVVYDA